MTIIGEHMFATGDDNGVVKSILYLYFIYIYYNFAFGRMESRNVVAWIDRLEVKFSLREIIFEYSFLQKL